MIVTNKKTGEDISDLFGKLMEGKITNKEFEDLTGLEPSKGNPHRKAWEKRNKLNKEKTVDLSGNGWYKQPREDKK